MYGPENGTRKRRIIDYIQGILKMSSCLGGATCDVQEELAGWRMNVHSTINTARFRPSRRNKLIAVKMVKNCVAMGCKSTCRDTVSFFKFPSYDHRREQWIRQVRRTRDRWNRLSMDIIPIFTKIASYP